MRLDNVVRRSMSFLFLTILISSAGIALAQPCPQGSFSATGSEPCTLCPAGRYSPVQGATECLACAEGTFSSVEGSEFCAPCEIGTVGPLAGLSLCIECAPGFVAPFTGGVACEACPVGTFQSSAGGAICTVCDPGFYQPSPGGAACLPCACDDGNPATEDLCDVVTGDCLTPVGVQEHEWGVLKTRFSEGD